MNQEIEKYCPFNKEEEKDKKAIMSFMKNNPDCYERTNLIAHMTSSCWIINKEKNKILMCYHKIYNSWSWCGGHADGDKDLLRVAIKEAKEETGLTHITPLDKNIFSMESLTVNGHYKRGEYVNSHLHLNVSYLLEADEKEMLKIKEDENKGLAWFTFDEVLTKPTETWMIEHVYKKLMKKLISFLNNIENK